MSYVRGRDRSEVELLPACLDDYVAPEAPARFIDVYADGLDFVALGFTHSQPAATGRPPYDPADLLKLYLYGYLNRIRSSRRLEAEAGRNLELIWLLRGLRPDFKTIADFRKDNRAAFKPLFKNFNLICRQLDLFGAELVAIDGAKFKAVNNPRRHYTAQQLRELMLKIEERIDHYLAELDAQDQEAEGTSSGANRAGLEEKMAQLKARRGRYDELLQQLQQSGENELSLTDPDSRKMKGAHGEHFVGYNVQIAVDGKHDLIVAQEVVQSASDRGQLADMALAAQKALPGEKLQIVADKGYHEADQLEVCEKAGLKTLVPAPGAGGRGQDGQDIFPKEQFHYDASADIYHCPAGQSLKRGTQNQSHGKDRVIYYNHRACRACSIRHQCTRAKYRSIARRTNEAVVERAALRVASQPALVARRKEIVEHVLGTLRNWHHDAFLCRTLEKTRGEFSLSALVYNFRRVINLVSLREFQKAV